jgi:hypothetical protein
MTPQQPQPTDAIERIFHAWDESLGAKDLDAATTLYQPDATLERPLVRHLLGREEGPSAAATPAAVRRPSVRRRAAGAPALPRGLRDRRRARDVGVPPTPATASTWTYERRVRGCATF